MTLRLLLLSFSLTLLLSGVRAQAQSNDANRPAGVITGRVLADDGSVVAGASVSLLPQGQSGTTGGAAQSVATMTDEEGRFKFTRVAPRIYSLYVTTASALVQSLESQQATVRVGETATINLIRGGVITGHVTDAAGDPIIGLHVQAVPLLDGRGRVNWRRSGVDRRITDDRGVYRLFGLPPGDYLVVTAPSASTDISAYSEHVPIYHPASTRDTATEVRVVSGGEATNIDIRYRADLGRTVSGAVVRANGKTKSPADGQVVLLGRDTGQLAGQAWIRADLNAGGFEIRGVPDGEYEVQAHRYVSATEQFTSEPRRITVKGGDVSGIELILAPLASLSGRVVIDPAAKPCESKRKAALSETLLAALPHEPTAQERARPALEGAVEANGAFAFGGLRAGRWRLAPQLPSEGWYVKSISIPPAASTGPSRQAAPINLERGVMLKPGEQLTNVVVAVAEGAATVSGTITHAPPGVRLRAYLVPAEATDADNVLRYFETEADVKGAFALRNIAPGKYLMLARSAPAEESPLPTAFDPTERAKLRREATAAKQEIALQPCQRLGEQTIKFATK